MNTRISEHTFPALQKLKLDRRGHLVYISKMLTFGVAVV